MLSQVGVTAARDQLRRPGCNPVRIFPLSYRIADLSVCALYWRRVVLAREHFCAGFPTVLAGHVALEAFHNRAHWRVVPWKVIGATSIEGRCAQADEMGIYCQCKSEIPGARR